MKYKNITLKILYILHIILSLVISCVLIYIFNNYIFENEIISGIILCILILLFIWFISLLIDNEKIFSIYSFILSLALIIIFFSSTSRVKYDNAIHQLVKAEKGFLYTFFRAEMEKYDEEFEKAIKGNNFKDFPEEITLENIGKDKLYSRANNLSEKEKIEWKIQSSEIQLKEAEVDYYYNLWYHLGFSFFDYLIISFLSIILVLSCLLFAYSLKIKVI